MENTSDLGTEISKNSLKYLSKIDSFLNNFKDGNVLRSYYLQKFKKREAQQQLNLPAKLIKPTARCSKCYVTRTLNCTKYRVCKRPRQFRFYRRLLRKVLNLKRLTPFQRGNTHMLRNYMDNKLVIRCRICDTKIEEVLNKAHGPDGRQGKCPLKKEDPIQTNKQPVRPADNNKKGKGNSRRNKKGINHTITKNKAKAAKRFGAMLSSKPEGSGKSGSLKDFLKSL